MNLIEKKEHLINRMPLLSPEEKTQLIQHFSKHPEDESKIDWNHLDTLKFNDFLPLLKKVSKTAKRKAIKDKGVNAMTEGTDYLKVFEYPYVMAGGAYSGTCIGYVPLTWEASKQLASKYVGNTNTTGEWCVAYQKNNEYWNQYCGNEESIFIYFVDYRDNFTEGYTSFGKVAVRVFPNSKYEVWDAGDHRIFNTNGASSHEYLEDYPQFLFDVEKMKKIISKARKMINDTDQGIQCEKTKQYEVRVEVYGETDEASGELRGAVYFNLMDYDDDYGYEIVDGGNVNTSSSFIIVRVGKGALSESANVTFEFSNFNCMNGNGVLISYEGGITPDDAFNNARRRWDEDINDSPDTYDIKRELKTLLNGEQVQYIIVKDKEEIDDYLEIVLRDFCTFSYVIYNKSNRITDTDHDGNNYTIFYDSDYNYTKTNANDWVSLPSQRKRDKQMDLPYGF